MENMQMNHAIGNKKDNLTIIYTPGDNLKVWYLDGHLVVALIVSARKPVTWPLAKFPSIVIRRCGSQSSHRRVDPQT